jgi:hypothetical protein
MASGTALKHPAESMPKEKIKVSWLRIARDQVGSAARNKTVKMKP